MCHVGPIICLQTLFIIVSKPKLILHASLRSNHMLPWPVSKEKFVKENLWWYIKLPARYIRCLRVSLNPWDPSNQSVQNFLISRWILVMKLWWSFRRLNSKLLQLLFMFNRYLWVLLIWYLPSKCMLIGMSPTFYPTWSTPRFFGFSIVFESTSPTQKMLSLIRGIF